MSIRLVSSLALRQKLLRASLYHLVALAMTASILGDLFLFGLDARLQSRRQEKER